MQEILKIHNLKFQYPAYPGLVFPQLLKGTNLSVRSGDFKIILGKPESGKSTILNILLSLIPRYTDGEISGAVEYKGTPVDQYKPYELIGMIGSVFQDPDEQIFTTSCDSEIAFALESLGIPREEMEHRVNSALGIMNIETLKHRNPATMSGGEKKRLLAACLYAADPQVWLLDEILDELDPEAALNIIKDLLEKKKTVLLFSSKMLDIFTDIPCDILILQDGKLVDTKGMNEADLQKLLINEGLVINMKSSVKQKILPDSDRLITIKNLKYQYPGNNEFSLFIENFHLKRGEIVALAGKNGSGKSTLGKLIAGLKEKESGLLTVNEKNSVSCGYLFQNPDYQIFLPTVGEELSFGLKLQDSEIMDTIVKFNLPDKNVPPALMSYGTRKRLQAAVYYLMDRDIYILDEADAGLSLEDYDNLINRLYKEEKGILIISHNLNLCSRYSNRVYLLDSGRIVYEIEDDIYNNLNLYFVDGKSKL